MNQNIKPIAMRCTKEQFDAIRPKLEEAGLRILLPTFITPPRYLTNFFNGKGNVTDLSKKVALEETDNLFEEWNEQTFLEHCGIVSKQPRMVTTADIGAKVVRGKDWKWYDRKDWKWYDQDKDSVYGVIVDNNKDGWVVVEWISKDGKVLNRYRYRIGDEDCYDLYYYEEEPIKQEPMAKYTNYTVPATDVLKIRAIACRTWKDNLTGYLREMDDNNNVTFSEVEIDAMFNAATKEQKPVLVEVFGEPAKAIEWNKIKTGSKVMIKPTGQHCNGIDSIDSSKPVDVVFYKTPHCINNQGVFCTEASHSSYCTFHQKGKYVCFAADKNVDYITEVIEH